MCAAHISVLLEEVVQAFADCSIDTFVDGTLGAGGHAKALLEAHPEIKSFVGIDQDPTARALATERLMPWKSKLHIVSGNFSEMTAALHELHIQQVQGILLDLGVSSMQFDQAEKGFSFQKEGPLDMRMDPSASLSAADIVNTWSEAELGRIFREYGEEKQWRAVARTIVAARSSKPLQTTTELVALLKPLFSWKKKGINPLTLVFQALRIAVNRELEVLREILPQAIALLAPGGRLAVISFHSLEDRIVKEAFRYAASDKEETSGLGGLFRDKTPLVTLITRKPIVPTEKEIEHNARSRSAKLRVVEKCTA